jgi:hypothetical protein
LFIIVKLAAKKFHLQKNGPTDYAHIQWEYGEKSKKGKCRRQGAGRSDAGTRGNGDTARKTRKGRPASR